MSGSTPDPLANSLVAALPRGEQRRLLAACEPAELAFGVTLFRPGEALRDAFFPLTACVSLAASVGGHPPLDMVLVGSEGMLGLSLALGNGHDVPMLGIVKCPGSALRLPAAWLRQELPNHPGLLRAMHRQLFDLLTQLARTAACTSFHEVQARLARWLLMTHDRAHADHFHLTHELLADMLGVQRSAVTIAAGVMQKAGVISYSRGEIQVLDRTGLEAMSCECYRASLSPAPRL
ncbi:Crp/Fnr family transcriptional regulator [Arenimonas soli]|uniref:Crp/Fnr family transcriptional regulator n=1 Tax=Arenimonas soli TaxID=2269504 RepID=A0ABQ1HR53_9GAMM|nr:Crp/Fnr family transcriptional regulator [Arenimonas soli]GGA86909.1 Crp/Fnr family transcriptional regulator [Arenimonas soli]